MTPKYKVGDHVVIVKPTGDVRRDGWPGLQGLGILNYYHAEISRVNFPYGAESITYHLDGLPCWWREEWLFPVENSNQFNKICKWCKVPVKKKFIESINFTFNYCPECGR